MIRFLRGKFSASEKQHKDYADGIYTSHREGCGENRNVT